MTSSGTWLASALLAAGALGCRIAPPLETRAVPPRVPRAVIERFRLTDEEPPARSAVAILGRPTSAARDGASAALETVARERPAGETATLELEHLLLAVERQFPLILAAFEELEIAAGGELAARGAFDTQLSSQSLFATEGFYEHERIDVGIEQPTPLWGTRFGGGYRLGGGDFAVWDGKAKTNEDGELRFGLSLPLLAGSRIDPQRVELWQARLARDRADATVLTRRLDVTLQATGAYWKWVAAGGKRDIAARQLALAEDREEQVRAAVEEGELAAIAMVDNRRLIVERRANLVRAERALQNAAILLSLFWRDAEGQPIVPPDEALPSGFPNPRDPALTLFEGDVAFALTRRPELRALELRLDALELERQLFSNQTLPSLDVGVFASQDLGDAVNDPDDKGDFELEALVGFELPLQRRAPRGKLRATKAQLAKLRLEYRFAHDTVVSEVQDAASAIAQTWRRLGQARENVALAGELEEAERLQLELGESDLFRVNLREQQSAGAAAALVDVLAEHFSALATYRAVVGVPYDEVLAGEAVGGDPLPSKAL